MCIFVVFRLRSQCPVSLALSFLILWIIIIMHFIHLVSFISIACILLFVLFNVQFSLRNVGTFFALSVLMHSTGLLLFVCLFAFVANRFFSCLFLLLSVWMSWLSRCLYFAKTLFYFLRIIANYRQRRVISTELRLWYPICTFLLLYLLCFILPSIIILNKVGLKTSLCLNPSSVMNSSVVCSDVVPVPTVYVFCGP